MSLNLHTDGLWGENGGENKYVILFVSYGWSVYKGLDVIVELSKKLNDNYQIVVIGTDDEVDKILPDTIIKIHRTNNQKQLSEIYSQANVLVNPTREEVFGMVNIEALACGTPVITFNTGGSSECVDEKSGCVVEKDDIEEMYSAIQAICKNEIYSSIDVKRHIAGGGNSRLFMIHPPLLIVQYRCRRQFKVGMTADCYGFV